MRRASLVFALTLATLFAWAQAGPSPGARIGRAARAFLSALTPEQRAQAVLAFADDYRFDWHYVPRPLCALTRRRARH